jgi:short-subunit dehydrogenase
MDTAIKEDGSKRNVVVITGASAGLGRALTRKFAKSGNDVALIARGKEGLAAAKSEAEKEGVRALTFSIDVADYKAVDRVASEIEATLGPIDVWVNNAMNSVFSPVLEMTPEEYKRVTEVTYLGQVYGALSALKCMIPRDRGVILFVGSALAYRGIPLQSAYCASKHAVEGFFDSLRTELLHDGSNVKISMIQLPAMNTTQFKFVKSRLPYKPRPMGTIYEPEVAADVIEYASRHDRREYYVGWPTWKAIIGNKIAPGLADRFLAQNGYNDQMTEVPEEPSRENNLWEPIAGDHGAHGSFSPQAVDSSGLAWLTTKGRLIGASMFLLGVLALLKLVESGSDTDIGTDTDN